jgi:glycosyltransferase involved in cell wall biosynthesis
MPDLSILCVTRAEECVLPLLNVLSLAARMTGAEFVLVADGYEAFETLRGRADRGFFPEAAVFRTESKGYIESVLDVCINLTTGRYVLRIDDDESIPPPLVEWLAAGGYRESDHWKFNRAHLINGPEGFIEEEIDVITSPPLWPDHQTRLSARDKSFGRSSIHCGSPHGGGNLCPYPIIHHKFVIKSREEREEIVSRYESIQPGAGSGFRYFSVPELIEEEGGKLETISYAEFVRLGYTVR